MVALTILELIAALSCVILDFLIYKYVRMEYEESKASNVLLKKLLSSKKRARTKVLIKELLKQPETT